MFKLRTSAPALAVLLASLSFAAAADADPLVSVDTGASTSASIGQQGVSVQAGGITAGVGAQGVQAHAGSATVSASSQGTQVEAAGIKVSAADSASVSTSSGDIVTAEVSRGSAPTVRANVGAVNAEVGKASVSANGLLGAGVNPSVKVKLGEAVIAPKAAVKLRPKRAIRGVLRGTRATVRHTLRSVADGLVSLG